ncbi:unnamed protein product, partial [Ectocarpus sp. 12 AP-2014]
MKKYEPTMPIPRDARLFVPPIFPTRKEDIEEVVGTFKCGEWGRSEANRGGDSDVSPQSLQTGGTGGGRGVREANPGDEGMFSHAGVEAGSTGDCPGSTEQDPAESQLDKMLPALQRCSTSTEIEEVIQRQYSRRRSGRTPDPCPANPRNDTGVRFNREFVKTASSILTGRSSTAYSRRVKDEYSVPTPPTGRYGDADSSDDGGDDSGDDSDGEEDVSVVWFVVIVLSSRASCGATFGVNDASDGVLAGPCRCRILSFLPAFCHSKLSDLLFNGSRVEQSRA